MWKPSRWRTNIITSLEVPEELLQHNTVIKVVGKNHAVIENYRSILYYTKEEIVLQTRHGKIKLYGESMTIPYYTLDEMYIAGIIKEVKYE